MTKRVARCSCCTLQGLTRPDCAECKGFGEYWSYRPSQGFEPEDARAEIWLGNKAPKLSAKQAAHVLELSKQGWDTPELMREFAVSRAEIVRHTASAPRRKRITDEEQLEIKAGLDAGMTPAQIAFMVGRSEASVRRHVNKFGLRKE